MPAKSIPISLYKQSWAMEKMRRGNTSDESDNNSQSVVDERFEEPKIINLFTSYPIYILLIGFSIWQLRGLTYGAWLGSGWPQWVAGPDRAEEFDQEINELYSISSLTLVAFSLIPGIMIDFCKKKFNKPDNEHYGTGVGFIICFTITSVAMMTQRLEII